MINGAASAEALSVLLDLIPAAGGILLLISFIRRRSSFRNEERELRKIADAFNGEGHHE